MFRPSLRDLLGKMLAIPLPSSELLGYCRMSLRDKQAGRLSMRCGCLYLGVLADSFFTSSEASSLTLRSA